MAMPPGYLCRSFEFADISRLLDVNAASLSNWLTMTKMLRPFGDKVGHRRVYSAHEAYVMALMVALHTAGVPVNGDAIATILSAAYDGQNPAIPEPGALLSVRNTGAAGITLHSANIWRDIHANLKELEIG